MRASVRKLRSPASANSRFKSCSVFSSRFSFSFLRSFKSSRVFSYSFGYAHGNAASSSSCLATDIPSRSAIGAYISSVSSAIRVRFSMRGTCSSVYALWSRSISLMMSTRMSFAVAANNLRRDSVWRSIPRYRKVPSFVTPSTSESTSWPNSVWMVAGFTPASSIVSWRSPAAIAFASSPACARRNPTSAGCTKYGSPE